MKKTINIKGMMCGKCTARVEKALTALGCKVVTDLKAGTAVVEAGTLDDKALREAVEDLGFDVVSIVG